VGEVRGMCIVEVCMSLCVCNFICHVYMCVSICGYVEGQAYVDGEVSGCTNKGVCDERDGCVCTCMLMFVYVCGYVEGQAYVDGEVSKGGWACIIYVSLYVCMGVYVSVGM
jgi:hypothetical protein